MLSLAAMILINRTIVIASYFFIMSIQFCHLSLISHSNNAFSINHDPSDGLKELESYSKSYSGKCTHFTLFYIFSQNEKSYIFAVCQNDIVVQIEMESMKLMDMYNICDYPTCDQKTIINSLGEVNFGNKNMMWFCSFVLENSHFDGAFSRCKLQKNNNIPNEISWTKRWFASTSNDYMTYTVQAQPYIFIGSYEKNSLTIIRTKFPNEDGHIDELKDLTIPMTEYYFEKNSQFVEAFSTKYEVFYVVLEPVRINSISVSKCPTANDDGTALITRLVRICKDDFDGLDQSGHFGTIAKSDIICPVGLDTDQYQYTRSLSASWSGDRLYILFDSQINSPSGKVLCVYDEIAFKKSLNSDLIQISHQQEHHPINKILKNRFPDLCRHITEKSLSNHDLKEASAMSIMSLHRNQSVLPITSAPLINLRDLPYHSVSSFRLSNLDDITVIILFADNSIKVLTHTENADICFLKDFQLRRNEKISQLKGLNYKSNAFVHISTNERIVQLQLSICEMFTSEMSCLTNATNICGWDSSRVICSLLPEDFDLSNWRRSKCRHPWNDDIWSLPETCSIKNRQGTSRCTCRYCLDKTRCKDGKRINVTDCYDFENAETYGNWSPWSECTTESEVQTRNRKCNIPKCKEKTFDSRICQPIAVTKTNWTKWYKATNTKYHVSFRVHCPTDEFSSASIEEREMLCDETCQDYVSKWSAWSDCMDANVQYRLLNCSSFDSCPHTNTEVKGCSSVQPQSIHKQGNKGGGYTIIHLILVILVVSLVWLIILIIVIVCIFRYNHNRKKKLKRRSMLSKIPTRSISTALFIPKFYQQKSMLSESSNEYFTPEIQFSIYNPNDISPTSTIPTSITMKTEKHPLILDD